MQKKETKEKKIYDGNCHTADSATNQVEITTRNSSNNKPNALEEQQQPHKKMNNRPGEQ